jgi:hypothetical protein
MAKNAIRSRTFGGKAEAAIMGKRKNEEGRRKKEEIGRSVCGTVRVGLRFANSFAVFQIQSLRPEFS